MKIKMLMPEFEVTRLNSVELADALLDMEKSAQKLARRVSRIRELVEMGYDFHVAKVQARQEQDKGII